jgi:predicted ABC-type ATPase
MHFIATSDVEENVTRVRLRGLLGGHSARADEVRDIYRRSLANLELALDLFERIHPCDSTPMMQRPTLVAREAGGRVVRLAESMPAWVPDRFR